MMTEEKFQLCIDAMRRFYRECDDVSAMPHWESINRGMAEFRASHPDAGAPAEKCRLYELLAEYAEPTLFTYHPFFFELKLRFSKNWGVPWPPQPASWLLLNQKPHSETYRENARLLRIRAGLCSRMGVTPRPPADIHSVGPFCCICVEDSGPGVDEAIVEQIFEPFFTTKPTGKGTGMGLSMSYGVSREHGGWIQYDRIESGASFTIILPVLSSQGDRV